MKALTVCQPFAELLLTRNSLGEMVKPIENRTWSTNYRGPLVIHAGASKTWMLPDDHEVYPDLIFGAVIGVVDLVNCMSLDALPIGLATHEHAEGPICWVVSNPRRVKPVPIRGSLGLWEFNGPLDFLEDGRAAAVNLMLEATRRVQ